MKVPRKRDKLAITLIIAMTLVPLGAYAVTRPPVHAETPLTFSAAGDYGVSAASWSVIGKFGEAFHLSLGDFSYSGNPSGWCANFTSSTGLSPVIVSGNHDTGDITGYAAACPFPLSVPLIGTYASGTYYFDYPSESPLIRVIMGTAGTLSSDEAFVQNAIRSARAAGIPWVAYGSHKVCIEPTGDKSCEIGQGFFDMLLNERVDLILEAHAHTYSRSHQINCGQETSFIASCVVDSDGQFVKGAGTVLVIQGIGGESIRSSGWGDPDSAYFAVTKGGDGCSTDGSVSACPSADFGTVVYTVTENSISARVQYDNGQSFDPWTIGPPGPQPPVQCTFCPATPINLWLVTVGSTLGLATSLIIIGDRFRRRRQRPPSLSSRAS